MMRMIHYCKNLQRISSLDNLINPILVCNEDHRFIALEQMKKIDVELYQFY